MATEDFVRNLSEYLIPGNLSDLTLSFGERKWPIHNAIACSHSKWFRTIVNSGFKETNSGVVCLHDEPEFADAIDCMVSYFYSATYDVSKYDSSRALLHAQVVMLADKYDCASLYKLARTSFASAVMTVDSDEWADIATLIYVYATTDVPDHVELRNMLAAAVPRGFAESALFFQNENIVKLLRSNANLAADVLLSRTQGIEQIDHSHRILICGPCHYVHVGPQDCSMIEARRIALGGIIGSNMCPQCGKSAGVFLKREAWRVESYEIFTCVPCGGVHTVSS